MYSIEASHIAHAHMLAVKVVLEQGETVVTEDGKSTFELDEPLCITVLHPFQRPMVHPANPFTERMMADYVTEMITPENKGFEYTYGSRIFEYPVTDIVVLDQIEWLISRLQDNPTSRRAIAITWVPRKDAMSEEPPCLQSVQFIIRNNKLNCVCYFRSNDVALAWGANAYAITALMFKVMNELNDTTFINLGIGTLTTISNCAHVYDSDIQVAKRLAYG